MLTLDEQEIILSGSLNCRISKEAKLAQNAVLRLLGNSREEIRQICNIIIKERLIEIASELKNTEITTNAGREKVNRKITNALNELGMEILQINSSLSLKS